MASVYVVDTNVWIELTQFYPKSNFSGLWDNLENLVKNNRIICPIEVLKEITSNKSPELYKWCKKNNRMFVNNNAQIIELVSEIMANHSYLVKPGKMGAEADPFVIALARHAPVNFDGSEMIIVTQEGIGSKLKIPFVAKTYGISSIKLMELIKREDWKF